MSDNNGHQKDAKIIQFHYRKFVFVCLENFRNIHLNTNPLTLSASTPKTLKNVLKVIINFAICFSNRYQITKTKNKCVKKENGKYLI